MKKTALTFYEQRRGNCAQSVAAAWKGEHADCPLSLEDFADCGHGRAPEGLCGALYASCKLAGEAGAPMIQARFQEQAGGHLTCRAIRQARTLRCPECVELAAGLLEEYGKKGASEPVGKGERP